MGQCASDHKENHNTKSSEIKSVKKVALNNEVREVILVPPIVVPKKPPDQGIPSAQSW